MGRSRYKIHDKAAPHFVTCTTVGWLPVFTRPDAVEIIFQSLRYLQQGEQLMVYAYVVMENHLHLVVAGPDLPKLLARFKSYTARQIIDTLSAHRECGLLNQLAAAKAVYKTDRPYQLWQEGSHPQLIQNDEMMRQKLEYIHHNPVRRGYVEVPEHWMYSSARDYAGGAGPLSVVKVW